MKKRWVLGFAVCMIIGLSSVFLYESAGRPNNKQPALSEAAESATNFPQTKTDIHGGSGGEGDVRIQ